MSNTTTPAKSELTNGLIERAFLDNPHFNPYDLEDSGHWLFRKFRQISEAFELEDILEEYNILIGTEFTDYAVNNGLAVKIYTQRYFATDLIMRPRWYVTGQGKIFMENLYALKKRS